MTSLPDAPQAQANAIRLARDFFARVWGPPHDLDAIDELMAEDYAITTGGKRIEGRSAFKAWVGEFQQKILEAENENHHVFASPAGDFVVSRWTCRGVNNGLLGLPATGEPIASTGIAIWRVSNGRLAECWVERASWELYNELLSARGDDSSPA
jgi:ketosteroid isomerase-like protein